MVLRLFTPGLNAPLTYSLKSNIKMNKVQNCPEFGLKKCKHHSLRTAALVLHCEIRGESCCDVQETPHCPPQSTLEYYMFILTDVKFKYRYSIVLSLNNGTIHKPEVSAESKSYMSQSQKSTDFIKMVSEAVNKCHVAKHSTVTAFLGCLLLSARPLLKSNRLKSASSLILCI